MYRVLPLLGLVVLSFHAEAARAHKIADACQALANGDRDLITKCVNHAELFELEATFIRTVVAFHNDVEVRMKALKSGANVDTIQLCKSLGWSLENTLSCLRAYPTPELLRGCKKLSKVEDEQLRCVRYGREVSQVNACETMSENSGDRFRCLELDVPALAAINCRNKSSAVTGRFHCLEQFVRARTEENERDSQQMRREALARIADPANADPLVAPSAPTRRRPASNRK